jgi:hypothetical protein
MDMTQNGSLALGPDEIPAVYHCALTRKLMDCPVMAQDGMTYDKAAILDWTRTKGTSPYTGQPMTDIKLKVDFVLLAKIQQWKMKAAEQKNKIRLELKKNNQKGGITSIA